MSLLGRMYRNETSVPFAKLWKPIGLCSLLVLIISVSGLGVRAVSYTHLTLPTNGCV